jgi:hypothetical protein
LLHAFNHLVRSCQHKRSDEDQRSDLGLHLGVILTASLFAYSGFPGSVTANVGLR